jgi:predicted dienelactone hydrolase
MIARVSTVLILSLLAVSLAAAQPAEIIEFPAPDGPYQVGSTYRHWVDQSRDETLTDAPNDKRELLVRFWYPADVAEDAEPLPALPFADAQLPVSERVSRAARVLARALPVDELSALQSHAYLDAPVADAESSYPVLLFSHSWGGMPDVQNIQFEALASHGYIVAAVYHPYMASAVVFPDDRVVEFQDTLTMQAALPIAAADLQFALDQLDALNTEDEGGLFTGRLDLERLGLFGMSFGGAAVVTVCAQDERCQAVVNEDGPAPQDALSQPLMFMYSGRNSGMNGIAYQNATGPAYSLTFNDFGHMNFTDLPLWPSLASPEMMLGRADALESVQSVNAYLVAFFDTYLKGEPSPLLDGPSADYPDVEFESRNTE